MPNAREDAELATAARLYFIEELSQKEVAEKLHTTRSNVSRMLTAARQRGVVQIRIMDPAGRDEELEKELVQAFGLSEALVARFEPGAPAGRRAGELAARWLTEEIREGQTIALSWGTSLQQLVWSVVTDRTMDVEIVQLVGGLSEVSSSPTGQELVRELAGRLGAHYRYLHAPAVFEDPELTATFAKERSIAEALKMARDADIALVGVGAVGYGSSESVLEQMRLSATDRDEFLAAGLVGDICSRFFDINGRPYGGAADHRVLGITLNELRKIPTVVGVATGREKAPGLLGAVRGGFLDVLCCDVAAARAVLELSRRT